MSEVDISKAAKRPWKICKYDRTIVEDNDGKEVVDMFVGERAISFDEAAANAALIVRAENRDHLFDEMVEALKDAREQLTHSVPNDCWATGPLTGNPYVDLIVCPGCAANAKIDAILAKVQS